MNDNNIKKNKNRRNSQSPDTPKSRNKPSSVSKTQEDSTDRFRENLKTGKSNIIVTN